MTDLPRWKSHKIVQAAKIVAIDGHVLQLEVDGTRVKVHADTEYLIKHKPQVGGYWVVYDDGYTSWSPAEAFEAGYTRI